TLDELAVPSGVADTHVHDDLEHAGNLHGIGVVELAAQSILDLVPVPGLEPGNGCLGGGSCSSSSSGVSHHSSQVLTRAHTHAGAAGLGATAALDGLDLGLDAGGL